VASPSHVLRGNIIRFPSARLKDWDDMGTPDVDPIDPSLADARNRDCTSVIC